MKREQWEQIERLYATAIELTPDQRGAYLQEACGQDVEIQREVESLLACEESEQQIFSRPAWFHLAGSGEDTDAGLPPPLESGADFGGYLIAERVGAGGMGEVYRAHDIQLGRDVALKIVRRDLCGENGWIAASAREAQVLATLNHPNIAAIYGLAEHDGLGAIIMELVEGDTLADRLARQRLSVDEALDLATQIAEALEYAHEHGIAHQDVKPANIRITPDGIVKVVDWGIATVENQFRAHPQPIGSPAYMAPEQVLGKPVDRRVDIWAFGVILYEMLAGHAAFHGPSVAETFDRVLQTEPGWSQLPAMTPVSIRTLLARCLDTSAKTRLQAIGEARIAIRACRSEPIVPVLRPHRGWLRTGLIPLAIALLVGGGVIYRVSRIKPAPALRLSIPFPVPAAPSGFSGANVLALSSDRYAVGAGRTGFRPNTPSGASPAGSRRCQDPAEYRWSRESIFLA
jgi:eukaryotic-like serine/threonine-protein kinase